MQTKEQLQELIGLVYDLNGKTKFDWFLDFSGHVGAVTVRYYFKTKSCPCCGTEKEKVRYINGNIISWERNDLSALIQKLKKYFKKETV